MEVWIQKIKIVTYLGSIILRVCHVDYSTLQSHQTCNLMELFFITENSNSMMVLLIVDPL